MQFSWPTFGYGYEVFKAYNSGVMFTQRWTAATLHHGVPQVSSASHFHTSTILSSAVSSDIPDVSGKLGHIFVCSLVVLLV